MATSPSRRFKPSISRSRRLNSLLLLGHVPRVSFCRLCDGIFAETPLFKPTHERAVVSQRGDRGSCPQVLPPGPAPLHNPARHLDDTARSPAEMGIWRDRAAFPHRISLPTPQSFQPWTPRRCRKIGYKRWAVAIRDLLQMRRGSRMLRWCERSYLPSKPDKPH
jgi:hypothetical protein